MLGDPRVLVLDEPANGLDPEGIVWMRRLLRRLATEGRTVLVSSHVLTEMQQLVDRVVIIDGGRLLYQGPVGQLASAVVEVRTRHTDELRRALADRNGIVVAAEDTGVLLTRLWLWLLLATMGLTALFASLLIFTCCHPALSREAQIALTLRVVCGLTTAQIAAAFLVPEFTVARRITRAKRKIADAGIPYRIPRDDDASAGQVGLVEEQVDDSQYFSSPVFFPTNPKSTDS